MDQSMSVCLWCTSSHYYNTFDIIVSFAIPLVALLTSWSVMCKENFWNCSVLQRVQISNLICPTANISLTSRSTVLLEKLIVAQLVKKYTALYGNRRFNAVFTRARHRSLSRAR
jgi:hypothetical protein